MNNMIKIDPATDVYRAGTEFTGEGSARRTRPFTTHTELTGGAQWKGPARAARTGAFCGGTYVLVEVPTDRGEVREIDATFAYPDGSSVNRPAQRLSGPVDNPWSFTNYSVYEITDSDAGKADRPQLVTVRVETDRATYEMPLKPWNWNEV